MLPHAAVLVENLIMVQLVAGYAPINAPHAVLMLRIVKFALAIELLSQLAGARQELMMINLHQYARTALVNATHAQLIRIIVNRALQQEKMRTNVPVLQENTTMVQMLSVLLVIIIA